jgi:hypothetical protein
LEDRENIKKPSFYMVGCGIAQANENIIEKKPTKNDVTVAYVDFFLRMS